MRSECGICSRVREVEMLASRCAPNSLPMCSECVEKGAENIDVLAIWIYFHGGLKVFNENSFRPVSWFDGAYKNLNDIKEYYRLNEGDIYAEIRASGDETEETSINLEEFGDE